MSRVKFAGVVGLLLLLSLVAGCWNRREIEDLNFVLAVGLDKSATENKVQVTVQMPLIKKAKQEQEGGGGEAFWVGSVSGESVFEAVRDFTKYTPKLYWGDLTVLVLGEGLSREGISRVIDFFVRNQELRPTPLVMVATGDAKDIIEAQTKLERIPVDLLEKLMKARAASSKAPQVRLGDFFGALISKGTQQPYAPRIMKTEEGLKIAGMAVFKNDRLLGWLGEKETRGFLWVKGEVNSTVIVVPCPEFRDVPVSFEVLKARSKIRPVASNGKVSIAIEIEVKGNIVEIGDKCELKNPEQIEKVLKRLSEEVEKEASMAITRAQQEYESDIFGFGKYIKRNYPEIWRHINWEEEFPFTEVAVKAKVDYLRKGLRF